ncbi:MAG: M1 family metallopeptidase [Candidatus Xenobia bacterium]
MSEIRALSVTPTPRNPDPDRLSGDVLPHAYDVYLKVSPSDPCFSGKVAIAGEAVRPVQSFELNAAGLDVRSAIVQCGSQQLAAQVQADPKHEKVRLTFPQMLPAGPLSLKMAFDGKVRNDLQGLYLGQDGGETALVSQCEAASARSIFPCFDEPAFKASMRWTVETDPGYQVITNGIELPETKTADGHVVHHYAATRKPIASYVSAVTVGHYESTPEVKVSGIPTRVWVARGCTAQGLFAQQCTEFGIPWLEKYFGQPYPFEKLDQVGVPGFDAGAMENAGAIFYRRQLLQMDPTRASLAVKRRIAEVVLHENAHQWFGNLVTPRWWDDLWLNEAFATWLSRKAISEWHADWQVWDWHTAVYRSHAMQADALSNTHPIYTTVRTPREAEQNFDDITYEKGSSVLRMLEQYLGEDVFQKGMQLHMERHKCGNASSADLWQSLEDASGQPVGELMRSWINQPGFPQVSASVEQQNGQTYLALSQERCFSDPARRGSSPQTWNIPVVVRYEDDEGVKTQRFLMKDPSDRIQLDVKGKLRWVLPNQGATGFYRTAMARPQLDALLQNGLSRLSVSERVGLLDDEWELAKNGTFGMSRYLDVMQALAGDRDGFVIGKICEQLGYLDDHLVSEADRPKLQALTRKLLQPQLERLGWSQQPGESEQDAQLRADVVLALAQVGRDPAVLDRAEHLATQEARNPNSLDPALANAVVKAGAVRGDARRMEHYLDIYRSRRDQGAPPAEQLRYIDAVSAFENPDAVAKVLSLVGNPQDTTIPQEQIGTVLVGHLSEPAVQQSAFRFLNQNWNALQPRLGSMLGVNRVLNGLKAMPDDQIDQVAGFFKAHPIPEARRTMDGVLDTLRVRGSLVDREHSDLSAWLARHTG